MANTDRLSEVVALIAERDEDFKPFELRKLGTQNGEEPVWRLSEFKLLLGYGENESINRPLNRAKITASKNNISIKDNFIEGGLFDEPDEIFITKYAAMLIAMNADPSKEPVAIAQNYFALQVDKQELENEKRLKARLDVANENHKLNGVAKEVGVQNFAKFNGAGVSGLYGGKSVSAISKQKGLKKSQHYLDYAGSEELAANLFRISQTAASLTRQQKKSENAACETHNRIGKQVRQVIIQAGNTPPELLPAANETVDRVATKVKKKLKT
ncbi:hypothetical protein [Rubinisphaera sp.]|uniref:hypothetical protein n=1 Tax=Rubinisphaera sp. TaxID=2024857 RepID=UPI000C11E8C6|nr:hypothetical protein [Rubinisphaera sp.]MBV10879.1 hypothetical protein [Rubinisphaera sp.]HCS54803.1 hypothetical protein [Planctomycetaceae bacterium]|tara:strand:+ start:212 stop:1024 length:813 start_codon:yes stop_codon:yes gene_type:complete